uniref:P-type domain-containing protein n=1 Tax=Varanus komodoensis TaxID=61221 RepID=A0A8D2LGM4_VARKO
MEFCIPPGGFPGSLKPDQARILDTAMRRECGYKGITRETCQRRGCCFDNRIRGVKWYPGQCDVQLKQRINCGYPYISAQECYNKGCCFDSSIAGTIWCFFPGTFEDLH